MYLSKSKYCAGIQCPKILWLDRNKPEQRAEQDTSHMEVGNQVGDLAMEYFGEYVEVPFDREQMGNMLTTTQKLIDARTPVICEASFTYDENFCSVDILRKVDDGYEIIEVKSSSGEESDAIKETYLDDMAYQYYVLSHLGLPIKRVSLMRLNKNYVRFGELDLKELFVITDCTEIVLEKQGSIPQQIEIIKQVATAIDEPEYTLGTRCHAPYECAYKDWCWRLLPKNNVFDIRWNMRLTKKEEVYGKGLITFQQVLNSDTHLTPKQLLQVKTAVEDLPPHIEVAGIREFLEGLTYPLYHLDFETIQPAVPLWDNTKTYQQIPFQYSIHIQEAPLREPTHREFLAKEGVDPRRLLAVRLCADIPGDVCVLAYNAGFEKGRIRELANIFPDLESHLMEIHGNIQDLALPFSKGYYYCKEMGGSYSIKSVLPALCGDDPELDYHQLDLIHHGSEAMAAFLDLHKQAPEDIERIRAALLAYCRLDTLAMVKVLGKLYDVVNKNQI
ncbi:hypothetical protein M2149_001836 [Lachnospiraceae bacterium PFB1-21]